MVGGCSMVRSTVWDVHDQGVHDEESQGVRRDVKGTKGCQQLRTLHDALDHRLLHLLLERLLASTIEECLQVVSSRMHYYNGEGALRLCRRVVEDVLCS